MDVDAIAATNNATLNGPSGEKNSFPVVTLPDGSKIPTGTVGALMINIQSYNDAASKQDSDTLQRLEPMMTAAIPVLHKAGMFKVFPPQDWISGPNVTPGRKFVGEKALEAETANSEQ